MRVKNQITQNLNSRELCFALQWILIEGNIMAIFLLASFSFVEGDSGIPVTLGIRPKTRVKRRARLFEAWKNNNKKIIPAQTLHWPNPSKELKGSSPPYLDLMWTTTRPLLFRRHARSEENTRRKVAVFLVSWKLFLIRSDLKLGFTSDQSETQSFAPNYLSAFCSE